MNPILKPFIAIFLAFLVSFLFPQFAFLAPYTIFLLGALLFTSMMNINFYHLKDAFKAPKKLGIMLGTNYIIFPLFAFVLALIFLFQHSSAIIAGFVLTGMVPMAVATIYWSKILDLNIPFAVSSTVVSLFAAPFLIPVLSFLLLRQAISIDFFAFFLDILTIIFVPLLLVFLLQKIPVIKENAEKIQNPILFFLVLSVMAPNIDKVLSVSNWGLIAPVLLLCVGGMIIPALTTRGLSHGIKTPIQIGLLLRNMALSMTLANLYFGAEAAIPSIFVLFFGIPFLVLFVYLHKKEML